MDQLADAGEASFKAMFGEFGLYLNGKIVALICDNQLFVKPTDAGRTFLGTVQEAPPYPGAKNYFLIEDGLDDAPWLCDLIRRTAKELPLPNPRSRGKKKKTSS
jgi:TfoX/Sxy family transcriptional regulator of competence genes